MTTILPRRGTAAQWTAANPVLAMGEEGYETDTTRWKRGDGTTSWTALAYGGSWDEIPDKPAVVAAGDTQIEARSALDIATAIARVSGSSNDSSALNAALSEITQDGKINGTVETVNNTFARITAPITIDLGHSSTENSSAWDTETRQKVKMSLNIVPDGGIGAALTIKGGYGAELDINVLGGGKRATVTDCNTTLDSITAYSPSAIADGLKVGAVVEITGAGYSPEGTSEKHFASVRSVDPVAGTFTMSEKAFATMSNTTMTWMDVAVRIENLVGVKLNIYGKGFDGCLIAADATEQGFPNQRRNRSVTFARIVGLGVGKTLFFKNMEAQGSWGTIMGTSATSDYIGSCDDFHWDHWECGVWSELYTPPSYVVFDRATSSNNLMITVGDRAPEALLKFVGGEGLHFVGIMCKAYCAEATATITNGSSDLTGVINTLLTPLPGSHIAGPFIPQNAYIGSVSGSTITMQDQNGNPVTATGTVTDKVYFHVTSGIKLIGVVSIRIDEIRTYRCEAGIEIVGGGSRGLLISRHSAMQNDFQSLVIKPGLNGKEPRIDIGCDYLNVRDTPVMIESGLTGGSLAIHGSIINPNAQGNANRYSIDCQSAAFAVDVAGLTQPNRSLLNKSINHADPALVYNVSNARLGNNTIHGSATGTSVTLTSGVPVQNASDQPIQVFIRVRHQPADGAVTTSQIYLGRESTSMIDTYHDSVQRITGQPAVDVTHRYSIIVPPWWWYSMNLGGSTVSISSTKTVPFN